MKFGVLRVAIGTAVLLVVVLGSIFRSAGWFIHDIYWLQEDLGGDKLTHVWMGAAVMLAFWLLLGSRLRWWLVAFIAVLAVALDELSQWWLPTRNFSVEDFAMGLAGVAVGLSLLLVGRGVGYCLGSRVRKEGPVAADE